ncbi:hypothetical protein [Liquorilactobacillus capillatus]|nr:hypothetical protein [Liquorilactobacillus capillatus]
MSNLLVKKLCDSMENRGYTLTVNSLVFKLVNVDGERWTFLDEFAHKLYKRYQGEPLTNDEIMRAIQIFRAEVRRRESK